MPDGRAAAVRGRALVQVRRYDEAAALFRRALAQDPQDADLWCELAHALAGAERFAEALDAADTAAHLAPGDEWPHRLRAIALRSLDRHREAVEAARAAVDRDPELIVALRVLADCLLAAGDPAGARDVAQRGLALEPGHPDLHETLGDVALSLGQVPLAERHYRVTLEHDPEDAVVLNNLGVAVRAQGREGDSARLFEAAARLDPRFEVPRENLADGGRGPLTGVVAWLFALFLAVQIAGALARGDVAVAVVVAGFSVFFAGLHVHRRRAHRAALSPAARRAVADRRARRREDRRG